MLSLFLSLPLVLAPQDPTPAPAPPAEEPAAEPVTEPVTEPAPPTLEPLPEGIAARAGDTLVPFERLDELLLTRHGKREEGLDVLNRLLTTTLLQELADAEGVAISTDQLNERIAELDARLKAEGIEGGLARQLEVGDVSPRVFRESLALQMAQEELTRRALGMAEGQRPSYGEQNTWLDQVLAERGVWSAMDAWPSEADAPVASAGETVVTLAQFHERLRHELPRPLIEQACTQLMLLVALEDLAGRVEPDEWEAAVSKELDARRARHDAQHRATPDSNGPTYEALLEAQGLSLGIMARDPAVEVTALTTILGRRKAAESAPEETPAEATFDERVDAGLLAQYRAETEFFDGYYGERLFLRACLQRATETPTELVPRSVDQSMQFFENLMPSIPDEEGFKAIVGQISDDPAMKESGGELGWFGRGDERLPENLRLLAFDHWAETGSFGVAGPIQVTGGVAILWVGGHQPAPEWPDMAELVLREHQGRILGEATPREGIQIYLDPPPKVVLEEQEAPEQDVGPGPEAE